MLFKGNHGQAKASQCYVYPYIAYLFSKSSRPDFGPNQLWIQRVTGSFPGG